MYHWFSLKSLNSPGASFFFLQLTTILYAKKDRLGSSPNKVWQARSLGYVGVWFQKQQVSHDLNMLK